MRYTPPTRDPNATITDEEIEAEVAAMAEIEAANDARVLELQAEKAALLARLNPEKLELQQATLEHTRRRSAIFKLRQARLPITETMIASTLAAEEQVVKNRQADAEIRELAALREVRDQAVAAIPADDDERDAKIAELDRRFTFLERQAPEAPAPVEGYVPHGGTVANIENPTLDMVED